MNDCDGKSRPCWNHLQSDCRPILKAEAIRIMFKIGYLQFEPLFGKTETNLDHICSHLDGVDADLVVLPELAFSGYAFRDYAEAYSYAFDPYESPITGALQNLCKRNHFHLVAGFAEKNGQSCYNSSMLIGPEGICSIYRKLHLFNTEKECFSPGNTSLEVSDIHGVKIGMMICFDWIFPEVSRSLALAGADIICHPSNLVLPGKCQYSMVTRCVENRVFAVTANRYGTEREITFTGASQIVGPDGSILHRAPEAGDDLHIHEIDVRAARDKHITARNDIFEDRRKNCYAH